MLKLLLFQQQHTQKKLLCDFFDPIVFTIFHPNLKFLPKWQNNTLKESKQAFKGTFIIWQHNIQPRWQRFLSTNKQC
jgi:hypothetical protein